MKLYMHPVSMTSRPVRLFIAESGIKVDEQVVDLMTGEHLQPAFAAINPSKMVPVLEDGDLRLTESSAILKYLADKINSPAYPKDLKQRARVNEVMDWFNSNFYRDFGYGLCYPQLFPHHKRPTDAVQQATLEWAQARVKNWLEVLNDHIIGPDRRELAHHRRLLRRVPPHARRGDPVRFRQVSQHQALARHREAAAELAEDQRSLVRLRRLRQGTAIRDILSLCARR